MGRAAASTALIASKSALSRATSQIARFEARCARLRAPTITAATPGRASMALLATVAMSVPWRSATPRSAASSAWNKSHPPRSSMMSRYLVSERLCRGSAGARAPSQLSLRNPPATMP
jgi:hypothetical protein